MAQEQTHHQIPPVVAVLGHVDHGKTTLLDAIRKSDIAGREHGGITQKIGASSVEIVYEGKKRAITFIDTPGHEAFMQMRGRGAQASDIGILVVSSVDGVKPQTVESIKILKATGLPFVVALTKSDLPDRNIDLIKQQLAKQEVMVEGFGGDIPIIEVSAKSGHNIKELLDLVLLMWDMGLSSKAESAWNEPFSAIVIESRLDPKAGPRATMVVKSGSVSVKDEVTCEGITGKVRSLADDKGAQHPTVGVGQAVEILGFEKVPSVGGVVTKKGEAQQKVSNVAEVSKVSLGDEESSMLSVMIVADTQGSLEAILAALPKEVRVMSQKTGDISEGDVLMAKSTKSILLGFNIKVKNEVKKLAQTEKVLLRDYRIIYELLDEVKDVVEGKKEALVEQILGAAKIQATFPFEKSTVLGVKVLEGRVAKGDRIRILHNDEPIGESRIVSLRQGKDQTSKVEEGNECGILISPLLDFTIGDVILCIG